MFIFYTPSSTTPSQLHNANPVQYHTAQLKKLTTQRWKQREKSRESESGIINWDEGEWKLCVFCRIYFFQYFPSPSDWKAVIFYSYTLSSSSFYFIPSWLAHFLEFTQVASLYEKSCFVVVKAVLLLCIGTHTRGGRSGRRCSGSGGAVCAIHLLLYEKAHRAFLFCF